MSGAGLQTISVANPVGAQELSDVMAAARIAQARWQSTPLTVRLDTVREVRRLIAEHAALLAESSASARRRPPRESLTAEVVPLAEACRFLERRAQSVLAPRRLGARGLPLWLSGVRSEIHREPIGVVLIIGPGNYPLLLPGVQVLQALVAGNAVLLKPGVGGSGAARALVEILRRAGVDSGLVALLPESVEAARAAIDARPDKVLFTGSAATGRAILAQLAPHLIPATLELSGCDAMIVRADANLDLVTKALVFALDLNNGATCMAPRRLFVHRSIATELEGRLAGAFLRRGCGWNSQSEARISAPAPSALRTLVAETISQGAHFIVGSLAADGALELPVILAGVHPSARLLDEDVFAPVLSVVTVNDDGEALAFANDCPYGLGASVFTRDEPAARLLAARLQTGVVTVNDVVVPTADARLPFVGRKRSGFGATRGAEGLLDLSTPKVVTVSRSQFRPAFDPPDQRDEALFRAYLGLTHGKGLASRGRALVTLLKSMALRGRRSHLSQP